MRIFLLFSFLFFCSPAFAQDLPNYQSTTVNDFAGLLDKAGRTRLHDQLTKLRKATGIEMTVVTLDSQSPYWPDMQLEPFATALFNHWGIGDKTRNDGIMVLVLHQDRAMRVELGKGFGSEWNRAAAEIINRSFLPAFKASDYQGGIETGVQDVVDTIALPFSHEESAPDLSRKDPVNYAIWGFVAAAFASVLSAPFIGRMLYRLKHCPQCNRRGLRRIKRKITSATRHSIGEGEQTVTCPHCNYENISRYTIARRTRSSSSSSGGFGGGSSSGGGASGRW